MPRTKRTATEIEGARESLALAATLGGETRATRRRRRVTQAELGRRVGLSQSQISQIERGNGHSTPLDTWVAIGQALDRPLACGFSRDVTPEPADAGHLKGQEIVLQLARLRGRRGTFELPTAPGRASRSVDVGLRDDASRTLILVEIWNRVDDIGDAFRRTDRKVEEALNLAAFRDPPYRVPWCWALIDSAANRAIVRRFPEIFRSRFRGSSRAWVRALSSGAPPPAGPGVVWLDPRTLRLTDVRLR